MKIDSVLLLSLLVFAIGNPSSSQIPHANHFTSLTDTLRISTVKVKGAGLFSFGAGYLRFKDTSEEFSHSVTLPKDVSDLKRTQMPIDFTEGAFAIDIIKGMKDGQAVFVVDQNANRDFTDDPIRPMLEMEWYGSDRSILCHYEKSVGAETVLDSSWVMIGSSRGRTLYARDEHLQAVFTIGKNQYNVGITDQVLGSTFTYGIKPELAVFSHNRFHKDTLAHADLINMGEYVQLDDQYYRFDTITKFGDEITLIREEDFASQVGTQVGMLAPTFDAVSTRGDTIKSISLRDRPIVIANSCGCGGDKKSTEAFFAIDSTYGNKIYALRLDSQIKSDRDGWQFEMDDPYNKDLSDKYRQAYCSRICYLIGEDRRILDKFKVRDWQSHLPAMLHD